MTEETPEQLTAHYEDNPEEVIEHVRKIAKRGDPDDILRVIDEYCWNVRGMMNVGDVKGKILDKIFKERDPNIVLELGSFIGYSAVRMCRLLKPGGKFHSIEIEPKHAKLTEELVEYAGLSDKVTVIVGPSSETITNLKFTHNIDHLDFVFIDHHKPLYTTDLKRLMEADLLKKGSVILADNMLFPGNLEYMEFVRSQSNLENEYFESHLEYLPNVKDGMQKSVYLGRT